MTEREGSWRTFLKFAIILIATPIAIFTVFHKTISPVGQRWFRHFHKINPENVKPFWQFEPVERLYDNRTDFDIPTKVILLWTTFFTLQWEDHFARNHGPYTELEIYFNTSIKRCFFTIDRSYLSKASAVMFHGRDLYFKDLPPQRFPWQRYVFYLNESPLHAGFVTEAQWKKVDQLEFNWTMTYSKLADVYYPYGIIRRSKQPLDFKAMKLKINNFTTSFSSRSTDAVWIVSNCFAPSKRNFYVDKLLALGITVDIFGGCRQTEKSLEEIFKEVGERNFFSNYRFYFAFENSICDDYITEKAFHAFYANFIAGTIPIVYGGGNYNDFFLEGSYINMRDFEDITKMADLMKKLSLSPPGKLESYYNWQFAKNPAYTHYYELVDQSDIFRYYSCKRAGWRNLCKKLWDDNDSKAKTSYVRNVRDRLGNCSQPDLSPLGKQQVEQSSDDIFNFMNLDFPLVSETNDYFS